MSLVCWSCLALNRIHIVYSWWPALHTLPFLLSHLERDTSLQLFNVHSFLNHITTSQSKAKVSLGVFSVWFYSTWSTFSDRAHRSAFWVLRSFVLSVHWAQSEYNFPAILQSSNNHSQQWKFICAALMARAL